MARETSSLSLFRRYEHNPILTPAQWPYPVAGVFNPGVASVDGETILLVRVEDSRGFSHLTVARSADGKTNWEIDPKPTLVPER
ncbi:glycosidase, partial [Candidatus Calescamantes bacterium]|nr:glycosidase [Candidatus Calescamantes bacterium]